MLGVQCLGLGLGGRDRESAWTTWVGLGWAGLTGLANEDQQFVSIFFLEDLGFSDLGFWA